MYIHVALLGMGLPTEEAIANNALYLLNRTLKAVLIFFGMKH